MMVILQKKFHRLGYFFSNSLQFFWLYPMVLTTNEIPKIITATIAATIIYE